MADVSDGSNMNGDPGKLSGAEEYIQRGDAYYNKYHFDSAIADYTEAVRLAPDYAEAYVLRGNAYFCNDDIDKATADYTEAIRLDPDDAPGRMLKTAAVIMEPVIARLNDRT